MGQKTAGSARTKVPEEVGSPQVGGWPLWAKGLVSIALLVHLTAMLAAALGSGVSTLPERELREFFLPYYGLIDQDQASYRYYSKLDLTTDPDNPRPWHTPVVTARLEFADGRGPREVRLPPRTAEEMPEPGQTAIWPRLRYQRHVALAYHLVMGGETWARSYARHLCHVWGCQTVSLYSQEHFIPTVAHLEAIHRGREPAPDLEGQEFYTVPRKIGEYRCDEF